MKSDRSAEVLHQFGLGRTIGFQAAVSDTSGGKHPESSHQLMWCLRRIVTQTKLVSGVCIAVFRRWLQCVNLTAVNGNYHGLFLASFSNPCVLFVVFVFYFHANKRTIDRSSN